MRTRAWLGLGPLLLACSSVTAPGPVVSGPGTAHPPADPGGPPPDPQTAADEPAVFAIRTLWLGDADRSGIVGADAWKQYGLDIDGKNTDKDSTDVCARVDAAPTENALDGAGGVDNSFGENIVPVLATLMGSDFSLRFQQSLTAGRVTNLIVVHGLDGATTASPLTASLVVAAPLGATPTWSAADVWPVDASSLADGDPASPLLAFGRSYVVGGVFVAEPASGSGEIALGLYEEVPWVLPIRHVQITMTVAPDGMSASGGVISGIIPTDRLLPLVPAISVGVGAGSCTAQGIAPVQQLFEQAQDIGLDGTNEAGEPCTGISVGLGFEAVRVSMGSVVQVAPLVDTCAGADGGS